MNIPSPFLRHRMVLPRCFIATAILAIANPTLLAQKTWVGANSDGGDGGWVSGSFSPSGVPTSTTTSAGNVTFLKNETYTASTALITIGDDLAAKGRYFYIDGDKQVTIQFGSGSSLTTQYPIVGRNSGGEGNAWLTLQGPATGSATFTAERIWAAEASANVGTNFTRGYFINGNIAVNLTTNYTAISNQGFVVIDGGASVSTNSTNTSGRFDIAYNASAAIRSHLSILNGSLSASEINANDTLRMASEGALTSNSTSAPLVINVGTGSNPARFQAAGEGLTSLSTLNIGGKGTLQIGVDDLETDAKVAAADFTLSSTATFATGATLEFDFFGDGSADSLILKGEDVLLNLGTGTVLTLNLVDGAGPLAGQSWSLIQFDDVIDENAVITGSFDLSQINTDIWDLTQFNQEGNWTVRVIPEPGTTALLFASAILAPFLYSRRRTRR